MEIDTAAQAIKELEADPEFQGRVDNLKLGIYCVIGHRIGGLYRHAREVLPEHSICVLSQYASRRVAQAYPIFITNAEDLKWTELYSWTEFDGQMFIQQNHVKGIDDLLSQMDATAPGVQHRSLLFNHWRTAENRTSIRYAAEATLMGERHREEFYRDYGASLGVKDINAFLAAQDAIEEVHDFNLEHHGNVGPADRKKVNAICERCIAEYEQVLRIFANQLPDRGCLGTMAAIWNGPVYGLMIQNNKYGGAPLEHPSEDVHLDLPPLPSFAR